VVLNGVEIAPGDSAAERTDYGQVLLEQRLSDALTRLNPELPAEALEDAFRKLTRPEPAELVAQNRGVHRLLVDGVTVEYRAADGDIRGAQARVVDFDLIEANDWLAVNQFSVIENKHVRRPDVVLFVNGLPLAILELRTRRTGTPPSGSPLRNFKPTRPRSRPFLPQMPCSLSLTEWKRG
jgi:type I restriction enzyme, R subunit